MEEAALGFTLDAASAVVALDDLETVQHLAQLIDSSLVIGPAAEDMLTDSGAPRFALLEPIRQFLAESLAEGAVRTLIQLDIASYTAIIGCNYAASHLVDCGRFEEATEAADQGIRWARELGRPVELNLALNAAQYVSRFRQDFGRAIALGSEALKVMRRTDDRTGLANALCELVSTLVAAGRADEAQLLADEAEQMVDEADGPGIRTVIARTVGRSRIGLGRYREAIRPLMDASRLNLQSGYGFEELGWFALAIEAVDPSIAATVLGAAQRIQAETGDPDVMPPPAVGGDFQRRLQEAHPGNVDRGARLGWAAIQPEVAEWAAQVPD